MRSTVNQTFVFEAVVGRYRDGMLPVEIVGGRVVYGGERLGYFEGGRWRVGLDVGRALGEVVGVGGFVGGGGGKGGGSSGFGGEI